MARHYVITDSAGVILRGFSDDFEAPKQADICICEDGGRHFELDGVFNPSMTNIAGTPLYKLENGKVMARTAAEIGADEVVSVYAPTLEERTEALENAMLELILGVSL